mmetsp:Transcript_46700/g.123935  ORF Transcript_46700/g.123935 Transcript_46700/m.123935 type:complete len:438 (-) Transcript_46700:299-1612(-)
MQETLPSHVASTGAVTQHGGSTLAQSGLHRFHVVGQTSHDVSLGSAVLSNVLLSGAVSQHGCGQPMPETLPSNVFLTDFASQHGGGRQMRETLPSNVSLTGAVSQHGSGRQMQETLPSHVASTGAVTQHGGSTLAQSGLHRFHVVGQTSHDVSLGSAVLSNVLLSGAVSQHGCGQPMPETLPSNVFLTDFASQHGGGRQMRETLPSNVSLTGAVSHQHGCGRQMQETLPSNVSPSFHVCHQTSHDVSVGSAVLPADLGTLPAECGGGSAAPNLRLGPQQFLEPSSDRRGAHPSSARSRSQPVQHCYGPGSASRARSESVGNRSVSHGDTMPIGFGPGATVRHQTGRQVIRPVQQDNKTPRKMSRRGSMFFPTLDRGAARTPRFLPSENSARCGLRLNGSLSRASSQAASRSSSPGQRHTCGGAARRVRELCLSLCDD